MRPNPIRKRTVILIFIGFFRLAAAARDPLEFRADSLFRMGRYQAALEAYEELRWKDTADAGLIFKHFLACEFRGGDCRKEERMDMYYAEKTGSPYLEVMGVFLRERLSVMRSGPRGSWSAFRAGKWISSAEFLESVGRADLARRNRLSDRTGLGLILLGAAGALTAVGSWAVAGGDCSTPRDETGCRNLQLGSGALLLAGIGLGYSGTRIKGGRPVPMAEAGALADHFNAMRLKRMILDLPLFRRLETGVDPA